MLAWVHFHGHPTPRFMNMQMVEPLGWERLRGVHWVVTSLVTIFLPSSQTRTDVSFCNLQLLEFATLACASGSQDLAVLTYFPEVPSS